jgi:hypothetical protein
MKNGKTPRKENKRMRQGFFYKMCCLIFLAILSVYVTSYALKNRYTRYLGGPNFIDHWTGRLVEFDNGKFIPANKEKGAIDWDKAYKESKDLHP